MKVSARQRSPGRRRRHLLPLRNSILGIETAIAHGDLEASSRLFIEPGRIHFVKSL